jgi:hypothetical protein
MLKYRKSKRESILLMQTFLGKRLQLYFDNKVFTNTEVEDFLLNEISDCIHNKDDLLICYPNSNFIVPMVLGSVLKNETDNFNKQLNPTRRTTILLITNNREFIPLLKSISLKTGDLFDMCKSQHQVLMENNIFCDIDDPFYARIYWRHIFSNYYNNEIPNTIPLDYFLPISKGYYSFNQLSRGEMNKIGRKDNIQESVFLVTNNINAFEIEQLHYDYVFIDFSTINKSIRNIPKGSLCFFDKPLDDRINRLNKNNTKKYFIDGKILEFFTEENLKSADSPFSRPISELSLDTNISNITIQYLKTEFEDELENAFILLKRLILKNFDPYDLRLLRTLLYNIIKMPVEAVMYDGVAKYEPLFETIKDLMKEVKESENRYEDVDFENLINSLENIYNKYKLDSFCPKYKALEDLILKESRAHNSIGIVSSNKISNIALKEKLAALLNIEIDRLEEEGIKFYNKKKLLAKQEKIQSDILVLPSAMNISDFNTVIGGSHKKTFVFLYKLEIGELKEKFRRLKDMDNLALRFFENNDKELINANNFYKYFYNRLRKFKSPEIIENEEISLTKLKDSFVEKNIVMKRLKKDFSGENAIPAKLILLEGGGALFLRINSQVRFVNKKQKKLLVKITSELKPGDEVILIDNDSRQDLFNVFIKNIKVINQNVINYSLIEKWREKFEDKYVSLKLDDNFLYKKLKLLGWDKSTKSILRNWRSGYSFGPRDLKDIELLGKVLGINDFIENSQVYFEAMSKIRVERRVAARILNKIIYYSKRKLEDEDLNFLKKYNLSIEDLRDAVKVRKVLGISEKVFNVKPSEIGILYKDDRGES